MNIGVTVLGAGSWGTTVAHLAASNVPTTLWARDPQVVEDINRDHVNRRYLDGYDLHPELSATTDIGRAVAAADLLVVGVPSQAFRSTLAGRRASAAMGARGQPHEGLRAGTKLRMTEIVNEVLPGHPAGVLTGPNLAKEILAGAAAASVIAMTDNEIAARLQTVFTTGIFRVYTNNDVVGSELGGALKNVFAVASGMADGLGTGDNTRAAVITRGLAELTRLGVAMGGDPQTFAGLAGMGDLVATCISRQSRNRHVGEQLGRGKTIEQVIAEMDQVAEGVKTARVVTELAAQYGIEMPIAEEVAAVCHEGRTANDAYRGLIRREVSSELDDYR